MARPQKNKVEYFPHPVTHGKKMSYMEKKYGNDGYAVWFKILEELGNTDFHYLNLADEIQIMFLSDRCLVSEEKLILIINDLVKLREFDIDLWNDNTIIFSPKYIESIKDAYAKRTNECINENSILILLDSLGVRKLSKSNRKPLKSNLKGVSNTQTILEETILEETNYTKREFLIDWNEMRTKHLKKPSFLNILNSEGETILKDLSAAYTRDDIKNAMVGLFKQKQLPNGNTTMQSNPMHFLKYFNSYLTAFHDTNDMLYGKIAE